RRRVHLDHVERGAVRDRDARVAAEVRRRRRPLGAVDRLREDAREGGLARPARACEEVRLSHLARHDRVRERPDDRLLADDVRERLWAVLAVQRGHSAIQADGVGFRPRRGSAPAFGRFIAVSLWKRRKVLFALYRSVAYPRSKPTTEREKTIT